VHAYSGDFSQPFQFSLATQSEKFSPFFFFLLFKKDKSKVAKGSASFLVSS